MFQEYECFLEISRKKNLKIRANSSNQPLGKMDRNSKKVKLLNNLFKKCMLYIEAFVDTHGVHRMEI